MRTLPALLLLLGLLLGGTEPARAAYPAPWPDSGSASVETGWTPYTYLGVPVKDKAGSADQSTGGTTPQQYVDVVSDGSTRPSVYYAYDAANQVFFFRFRVASEPYTPTPNGASNDDPLSPAQWNVLIDVDGDGFREFIVSLDGRTGAAGNPVDDIVVYHGNDASNAFPATITFTGKAGLFTPTVDADARAEVVDTRLSREVAPALTGGSSWYLDFQVPLSAFVVGGQAQITPTTFIGFGWATANSNTDPFQKDAVYDGAFLPGTGGYFPFGDSLTPTGGVTQNPLVLGITANCTRPADVLQATVRDTLVIQGGAAVNTIQDVRFYWQPDANGDGTPDAGSTPTLIATVTTPVPGRLDLYEYVWNTATLPGGTFDIFAVARDSQGNLGTSPNHVCTFESLPLSISGTVFEDANHDAVRASSETGTGLAGLWVKMVPQAGGAAVAAAPVNAATGAYTLTGMVAPAGIYSLRLDDNSTLTDTTPSRPAGWVGTLAPAQERTVSVMALDVRDQDFGLYHGSTLAGRVFRDDGSGGGTAHDGLRQAGEPGLPGVSVQLRSGGTVLDSATTSAEGTYLVYVPFSAGGATLAVQETNLPSSTSVSGRAGSTGGSYDLASDRTTFVHAAATAAYTGVDFGDVGATLFLNDGQGQAEPGGILFYPHRFLAGTSGTLTFSLSRTASPPLPNWSSVLYRDLDADGTLDAGEPLITEPVEVTAGQELVLLLKEFVPVTAPEGARDHVTVTATLQPGGTAQALVLTRTDVTTVTGGASVSLQKSVNLATASPGQTLTYTITYLNRGTEPLNSLEVHDQTPAYTTFVAAAHGALPAGLTGCTIVAPAVGRTGALTWTFLGVLQPGASGTVTFQVKVR